MGVIIHSLKARDLRAWNVVHGLCIARFLEGGCYAFAVAFHEGLGWPILGLIKNEEIYHALLRAPSGEFFDARGFVSEKELGGPFRMRAPYDLREIRSTDLGIREGEPPEAREYAVRSARHFGEALWPELPWQDSLVERVRAFMDDLDQVCRKHGMRFDIPYPSACPVVRPSEEETGGYELHPQAAPTGDGISFAIQYQYD